MDTGDVTFFLINRFIEIYLRILISDAWSTEFEAEGSTDVLPLEKFGRPKRLEEM